MKDDPEACNTNKLDHVFNNRIDFFNKAILSSWSKMKES